ncbi:MAG: hypothetical protein Q4B93_05530 [Clostridia bacterium]|nr:hypothetical protein [Clostridia bacterium]
MNKELTIAKKIILDFLEINKIKMVDMFLYGDKKIEFMIEYMSNIISVSITDELWYDFMVFDNKYDQIIYSNTVHIFSVNEIQKIIQQEFENVIKII